MDTGCGYRTVSKILGTLNELLEWNLSSLPSANSISSWIQKCGCKIYDQSTKEKKAQEYALIFDESMLIGSQRLLLTLLIKASKENEGGLKVEDVQILNMSVKERWDSYLIKQVVEKATSHFPQKPTYILSDNDTKLKKSIELLQTTHIADVGHTLALCLEKTYKEEPDFKEYMKNLSALRYKNIMTSIGYLLPPSQRTIARFMNLRDVIKWSVRMKENIHKLGKEKHAFLFIREYASLIDELEESFTVVDTINQRLKKEGFSDKIYEQECQRLQKTLWNKNHRQQKLASLIQAYFREQKNKMDHYKRPFHISSDIVESLFSVYKRCKSPNPLHGVSGSILLLPLLTKRKQYKSHHFKDALQSVSLKDLKQWKENNLPYNQAYRRQFKLTA